MDINNKYTGFEKLLQNKLSNYEFPYNNKDWNNFKKKLPKSSVSFISPKNLFRFFIIAASVIIPTLVTLYFINILDKPDNKNKTVANQKTIDKKNNSNQKNNVRLNNNINPDQSNYSNKNNSNSDNLSDLNKSKKSVNITKDNSDKINNVENSSNTVDKTTVSNKNDNNGSNNTQLFGEVISADILEGCVPLKVRFNPLISEDTISYLWEFGDGKTSTKTSPSHIYNKAGIYTVSLTVKFAKSKISTKFTFSKNITVNNSPLAQFYYTVNSDGDQYSFTDNSTNALYWCWTFGDKSSSLKEKNTEHIYKMDGSYNVQLIVMNASGCSDTITKKITVSIKPPYECPGGFTPNGDGLNDYFGPIGKEMNPDGYKIYIFDKNGLLIFETSDIEVFWDGNISGSNTDVRQGIYFWKITMKNKYGTLQEKTGWVTLIK